MTDQQVMPTQPRVPDEDAMLRVNGLSKRYGGLKVVDDVSFEVARGEICALIGPNGAGKTTTFNLLTGFVVPDKGEIFFDGAEQSRLRPHLLADKGLVRTFQTARMFPSMTVREIVATAAMLRHGKSKAFQEADACMERLGITGLAAKSAGDLSLPDRQLVELAKCVALEPRMILLDEIMGGLNRAECEGPIEAIRSLREEGMTFLLVEHVMPIVMNLAEHIVVLDFGRRIAAGTPDEISRDPLVRSSYLGGDE